MARKIKIKSTQQVTKDFYVISEGEQITIRVDTDIVSEVVETSVSKKERAAGKEPKPVNLIDAMLYDGNLEEVRIVRLILNTVLEGAIVNAAGGGSPKGLYLTITNTGKQDKEYFHYDVDAHEVEVEDGE